jgi:hypothetical protein
MAQGPKIQRLTDDLAILARRENHSIEGATANRSEVTAVSSKPEASRALDALGHTEEASALPEKYGIAPRGRVECCKQHVRSWWEET